MLDWVLRGWRTAGAILAVPISCLLPRLAVLLVASLLAFALQDCLGDPVSQIAAADATLGERADLQHALGLERPFSLRFGAFLAGAVQGDLGRSFTSGEPVVRILWEAAPVTLDMAFVSFALSLGLAIPTALRIAAVPRARTSQAALWLTSAAQSIPVFVTSVVLLSVFATALQWLPAYGRGETVRIFGVATGLVTYSGWQALVLPSSVITLQLAGAFIQLLAGELRTILPRDHIIAARARGVRPYALHVRHALPNAWTPLIGFGAVRLGQLIAFAIVTETIFQRPGLGFVFYRSLRDADLPVVAGALLLAAVVFVVLSAAADCLLRRSNPRLRDALRQPHQGARS